MSTTLKKNPYQLVMPGHTQSLASIRWVITRLASAAGLPSKHIDEIEMAVDEACANVLDHAYRDQAPKPPLHIEIQTDCDGSFVVDVIDQGPGFNYASYEPPNFPEHWMKGHERGAGLFLIRKFVDDVQFDTLPNNHNRIRLIKHFRNKPLLETGNPEPGHPMAVSAVGT